MFFQKQRAFIRAALHGMTVLGIVLAAGTSASPAYAAVTNDNRANAVKITTAAYSASISDVVPATTEASDPVISCGGSQGQDSVWWVFTPATSGEVAINTNGSEYDTILAVYKNDPLVGGGLIEMGCNDNSGGATSSLVMALRGGVRYYIEVVRKTGSAISSPDKVHLNYLFVSKVVAWSEPLGKKWDANATNIFTYTSGWNDYPVLAAYNHAIKLSNNVNGTATAYFDGSSFDLYYATGPTMGTLEVYVDNALVASIGQGAATVSYPNVWSSPAYSDNVHKLVLRHAVGGTTANFDYIQVFPYPDVIAPARITTLTAETGAATGKVILKWKAVGDDGNVGTAAQYELRYIVDTGVVPNCIVDWASATPYTGGYMPAPSVAGTAQQTTLTGLAPGVKYHFCLVAIDEVGNMGIPSNRATAIANASVLYGTGTYDDKNPAWTYIGNWELVSNPDARYNTQHNSTKIGDFASFYFTGKQFVLTYLTGVANGLMDVYIDGLYETTIDQYTFYPHSFTYASPILANGPHSVRFVHMTQAIVTVDQIYVWQPNDFGPPNPIVDLAAVPGTNDGEVDLTWTATGDDGASLRAKNYEVRYSTSPILDQEDWADALPAAGATPTPPQLPGVAEAMTVIGLTPGAHYYFAVRVFDNAYYDAFSNTIDTDVQYLGAYAPAGLHEDNHAVWDYIGLWNTVSVPDATSGFYHRIGNTSSGNLARFWFTGTKFRFTYMRGPSYGKLEVYVDGAKIATLNQYYASTWWNQNYFSPVFAAGNHVVEFRVVGDKGNIDAIRIWP